MRIKHHLLWFTLTAALTLNGCQSSASITTVPASQTAAIPTPTTTAAVPTPPPTPEVTDASACPPLDAALLLQMAEIESQVAQLRGIMPSESVSRSLLTSGELREHVIDDFLGDYTQEEALQDVRLLSRLGLIEPGIDLWQLYADLFTEQIAGFYDTETGEMIVVCGSGFGGVERLTYAHEYTHALQDQAYDIRDGLQYNNDACEDDSERCFAIQALIEGDATLLQEQWLRTFARDEDRSDLLEFFADFDMPVFDSAPAYIQSELTFPYFWGLHFIRTLYLDGGWAAVDTAYQNPPLSSEQILHPERYPKDPPVDLVSPNVSDALNSGWEKTVHDVLGEWATRMVLNEYLPIDQASLAAEGWGGDLLLFFYQKEDDVDAFVLITQWDTMRDAHEFSAAFLDYGLSRYGDPERPSSTSARWLYEDGISYFERVSNQTIWILAPDEQTLEALQNAIYLPLRTNS
ncbi:MAG: hypothetical protein E3J69_09270 [Anaerolineales bacterium]|nr:MAG: hypothetical protein E3J69_09270 [Anaerolineales bacterium]